MKYLAYILVLMAALFMLASCSKDKDDKPFQFSSEAALDEYLEQHDWMFMLLAVDGWDIDWSAKTDIQIVFDAHYNGGTLNPNDTFSLSINGTNVKYNKALLEEYGWFMFDPFSTPAVSTVDVIFKRNNNLIFDKTVNLAAFSNITNFPSNPNWNQSISVNWTLSKDSHVQMLNAGTFAGGQDKDKTYFLNPAARSYTIPAGELFLPNIMEYYMSIIQMNFIEYKNNVLISMTIEEKYKDNQKRPDILRGGKILEKIIR